MRRVDTATAIATKPPYSAEGTPGYFTSGNRAAAIPATVPGPDWFNMTQEEIVTVILAAGLGLDPEDDTQLAQAIAALISGHNMDEEAHADIRALIAGLGSTTSVEEFYIDAGAMTPAITGGAALAVVEDGTNDLTRNVMSFQGSTADTKAAVNFRLPSNWDRETVKAKVLWTPAAGASAGDDVRFSLAGVAVSDDDALDVALGSAVTIDDDVIAVGDLHVSPASAPLTIAGTPQVGDYIRLVLTRDYDYGASPMSEAAQVLGIVLQYGITGSITAW